MRDIPCRIIRGGSSKGLAIHRDALPPMGPGRDAVILRLFGSPDARQIDGLGGSDKLTSKLAVIGPPSLEGCDIDYHFAQVGIAEPVIDWSANCGNIAAGVALLAADQEQTKGSGEHARVVIHKVNVRRRIIAHVPMADGRPAEHGDYAIGGVPGTAPRIDLDFADFAGCMLGRGLFPTGTLVDTLAVRGGDDVTVTILDLANLHAITPAADLGIDRDQPLTDLQNDRAVIERIEALRAGVAERTQLYPGLDSSVEVARRNNPLIHIVFAPTKGASLEARSFTRGSFSKAFPVSGAFACASASQIAGTVIGPLRDTGTPDFAIRHPSGVMTCRVEVTDRAELSVLHAAVVGRTARILMTGTATIPEI